MPSKLSSRYQLAGGVGGQAIVLLPVGTLRIEVLEGEVYGVEELVASGACRFSRPCASSLRGELPQAAGELVTSLAHGWAREGM